MTTEVIKFKLMHLQEDCESAIDDMLPEEKLKFFQLAQEWIECEVKALSGVDECELSFRRWLGPHDNPKLPLSGSAWNAWAACWDLLGVPR